MFPVRDITTKGPRHRVCSPLFKTSPSAPLLIFTMLFQTLSPTLNSNAFFRLGVTFSPPRPGCADRKRSATFPSSSGCLLQFHRTSVRACPIDHSRSLDNDQISDRLLAITFDESASLVHAHNKLGKVQTRWRCGCSDCTRPRFAVRAHPNQSLIPSSCAISVSGCGSNAPPFR